MSGGQVIRPTLKAQGWNAGTAELSGSAVQPAASRASQRPAGRRSSSLAERPVSFLTSGIGLATLVSLAFAAIVLFRLGGWQYYTQELDSRAYTASHRLLKPSGVVGKSAGIVGLGLMLIMQVYSLRKRRPTWARFGSVALWLEIHIFCGIVGPVLVAFHTSFKFNGVVSVAFWSMAIVVLSGFMGRYLYVRIPRARGHELDRQQAEIRAAELKKELARAGLPPALLGKIEKFEIDSLPGNDGWSLLRHLLFGEMLIRWRSRSLSRQMRQANVASEPIRQMISIVVQRGTLLARLQSLNYTKKLFALWQVYHKPLAVLMTLVVALHLVAVAYFGYALGL